MRSVIKSRHLSKIIVALALLVCFVLSSLLLEAFVLTYADHAHDHVGIGETCATCAQIQAALDILSKQLGAMAAGIPPAFACLAAARTALCSVAPLFALLTLVDLKIRMNK